MSRYDKIVTIDELLKPRKDVFHAKRASEPTPEAIARMKDHLISCGFERIYPAFFDKIAVFGARLQSGIGAKGLFINGDVGVGKTEAIKVLSALFNFPIYDAKDVEKMFIEMGRGEFEFNMLDCDLLGRPRIIAIDDIGIESCPLVHFGSQFNVISDVLALRYREAFSRYGVITLVTTNLDDRQLRERYEYRIDDRLNQMFDFVTVKGKSLRK